MSSTSITTKVAKQYRLQEWTGQVQACQNRLAGMRIIDWCAQNGISKADYYYRLRCVRKACLESIPDLGLPTPVVAVPKETMCQSAGQSEADGLAITIGECLIHVTPQSSMELLRSVLQVIAYAK